MADSKGQGRTISPAYSTQTTIANRLGFLSPVNLISDVPGGMLCDVNVVIRSWSMNGIMAPGILSGVGGVCSAEIFLIR